MTLLTVVLSRRFKGASADHYSFNPVDVATLNYISAAGSSQAFGYHKIHDALTLSFAPPGAHPFQTEGWVPRGPETAVMHVVSAASAVRAARCLSREAVSSSRRSGGHVRL